MGGSGPLVLKASVTLWRTRKLPGPRSRCLFGNYFDLIAGGWGVRDENLKRMHAEYGDVFCLWQPFPCPPLVVTSRPVPEADAFDSVRIERTLVADSIMSLKDSPYYQARLAALQRLKLGDQWTRFEEIVTKWCRRLPTVLQVDDDVDVEHLVEVPKERVGLWVMLLMCDWLLGVEVSEEDAEWFLQLTDEFVVEVTMRTHQPMWMWYVDFGRWEKVRITVAGLDVLTRKWMAASPILAEKDRDTPLSHDEVLFALVAGQSTTAEALWTCLARIEEFNEADTIELDIIEVLKKQPTVPFSSKVVGTDVAVDGFVIPKGCRLMRPKTIVSPARSPFGMGHRRCYGQRFAEHILKQAVAAMHKRYVVREFSPRSRVVSVSASPTTESPASSASPILSPDASASPPNFAALQAARYFERRLSCPVPVIGVSDADSPPTPPLSSSASDAADGGLLSPESVRRAGRSRLSRKHVVKPMARPKSPSVRRRAPSVSRAAPAVRQNSDHGVHLVDNTSLALSPKLGRRVL